MRRSSEYRTRPSYRPNDPQADIHPPHKCLAYRLSADSQQTTEKKSPQRRGHSSILHSSARPSLIDDCRTTKAELTTPTNAGNRGRLELGCSEEPIGPDRP